MPGGFSIELDGDRELARRFTQDPAKITVLMERNLRQAGRTATAELGRFTAPSTNGQARAVSRVAAQFNARYARSDSDINRQAGKIYDLMKRVAPNRAATFWAMFNEGRHEEAIEYARRSRLPRKVDVKEYRQRRANPEVIAMGTSGSVQRGLDRQLGTIGTAKAAFLEAQQSIGGRSRARANAFPRFVKVALRANRGRRLGGAIFSRRGDNLTLRIFSAVDYASRALSESQQSRALDFAERRFRANVEQGLQRIYRRGAR